jgi:hypothetical protein
MDDETADRRLMTRKKKPRGQNMTFTGLGPKNEKGRFVGSGACLSS